MAFAFDDAFLAEVRDRNNIVSVIGDYVSLRKAGTHYKGLCPFHSEKTPSFTVREDRQFFYCFGCQTGGDVINFIREINGYAFVPAVKALAERAGMTIPEARDTGGDPTKRRSSRKTRVSREQKDVFYEVGGIAQRAFRDAFGSMAGAPCRDYVRGRGITNETCDRFGLGFAPDGWDGLLDALRKSDADLRVAETLGLIVKRKDASGHYDRFRNRLMFPIRNIAGEIVAFGGRTLVTDDKTVAKYVNSPDSPVYQKGDTLFGLYEARKALRADGVAVVVEGNLDLVRLSQEGIANVVAPMGTALTEEQCRLLARFAKRVVLIYDGDSAGRAAAHKAIPMVLAAGLSVDVVMLPDGDDPDTFIGREGAEALRALFERAIPGWDHLVSHVIAETHADRDVNGKLRAIDALGPVIMAFGDPRARKMYQRQLAHQLSIDEQEFVRLLMGSPTVRRQAQRATHTRPEAPAQHRVAPTGPPPTTLELKLLKLMILAPEASALYLARDLGALLDHAAARRTADTLANAALEAGEPGQLDTTELLTSIDDTFIQSALFAALADAPPPTSWSAELDHLVPQLKDAAAARRATALGRDLHQTYQARDDDAATRLLMERIALERERERFKQ